MVPRYPRPSTKGNPHTASPESSDPMVRKVDQRRHGRGHHALVHLTVPFNPRPPELYERNLFTLRKQPVFLAPFPCSPDFVSTQLQIFLSSLGFQSMRHSGKSWSCGPGDKYKEQLKGCTFLHLRGGSLWALNPQNHSQTWRPLGSFQQKTDYSSSRPILNQPSAEGVVLHSVCLPS